MKKHNITQMQDPINSFRGHFLTIYQITKLFSLLLFVYCIDHKFSDRYVWANSADPDQNAPEMQSDQGLHCLKFHLHLFKGLASLFQFKVNSTKGFWRPKI